MQKKTIFDSKISNCAAGFFNNRKQLQIVAGTVFERRYKCTWHTFQNIQVDTYIICKDKAITQIKILKKQNRATPV